jgi:hypothetical protein
MRRSAVSSEFTLGAAKARAALLRLRPLRRDAAGAIERCALRSLRCCRRDGLERVSCASSLHRAPRARAPTGHAGRRGWGKCPPKYSSAADGRTANPPVSVKQDRYCWPDSLASNRGRRQGWTGHAVFAAVAGRTPRQDAARSGGYTPGRKAGPRQGTPLAPSPRLGEHDSGRGLRFIDAKYPGEPGLCARMTE